MRAQTTVDFAIGMAIFLGVMAFAFSFVPGIFEPFELGDEEEPSLSDRIADSLAQDLLGSPAHPHVLDRDCTVAFFSDSGDTSDCHFGDDPPEQLFGLDGTQSVTISLKGNSAGESDGQLCWSDDQGLVGSAACDPESDVELVTGDGESAGQTVTTARRTVSLEGEPVVLEVQLW